MAVTPAGTPTSTTNGAGATSLTVSFTVPPDGDLLAVSVHRGVSGGSGNATSVTYNTDPCTAIPSASASDGGWPQVSGWGRIAPDVGTFNVVANFDVANQAAVIACAWAGAHQVTPFGTAANANGSAGPATVNAASAVDGVVYGALMSDSEAGVTPSGTEIFETAPIGSDTIGAAQYYPGTGSPVAVTWTQPGTGWAVFAVGIQPAAGAGGGQPTLRRLGLASRINAVRPLGVEGVSLF